MQSSRISKLSFQLFLVDAMVTPLGLWVASMLRANVPLGQGGALSDVQTTIPWPLYIISILCWSTALALNGVYDPQRVLRWVNEAVRVVWSSLVAIVLVAGFLYLTFREISRLQFIYFFLINLGILLVYRAILRISYRLAGKSRPGGRNHILILGAGVLGCKVAETLRNHSRWGFNLVGFLDDDPEKKDATYVDLPVLGRILDVQRIVQQNKVNEVWVALPVWALDRLALIMRELEKVPVRIKIVPDYYSMALIQAKAEILDGIPVIGLRDPVIEGMPRIIKRFFDLIVTSILTLISLPVMFILALAIRLDSPGSALFKQPRVGENGRIFEMLKFRTMILGADAQLDKVVETMADGKIIHKRPDDPRVTRVGRFLRHYSLDELPQLFNILKGDMSLVGPRPEMPWLVEKYDSWQRKRFAVPQGLTGWWQINGRSDKPMHLNTDDDLYYVYNYSLWLDIMILVRTPIAVFQGRGAF